MKPSRTPLAMGHAHIWNIWLVRRTGLDAGLEPDSIPTSSTVWLCLTKRRMTDDVHKLTASRWLEGTKQWAIVILWTSLNTHFISISILRNLHIHYLKPISQYLVCLGCLLLFLFLIFGTKTRFNMAAKTDSYCILQMQYSPLCYKRVTTIFCGIWTFMGFKWLFILQGFETPLVIYHTQKSAFLNPHC